jgi:hypothetical protein
MLRKAKASAARTGRAVITSAFSSMDAALLQLCKRFSITTKKLKDL